MATKREMEQRARYYSALQSLGFTYDECEQLRRISRTLRRWHELECGDGNGCIDRDVATGKPMWVNAHTMNRYPMADRETGAKKRLASIISGRNQRAITATREPATIQGCANNALDCSVTSYIQGDPRGAALYILRPGDVPEGQSADAYYSRGICVF